MEDEPQRPDHLKPKYHYLRFEAAAALWRIDRQYKIVVPILIELFNQEEGSFSFYRTRATDLLGEIGPYAIEAVPELLKAAKKTATDEERYVGDAAIKALKKIDPKAKWN